MAGRDEVISRAIRIFNERALDPFRNVLDHVYEEGVKEGVRKGIEECRQSAASREESQTATYNDGFAAAWDIARRIVLYTDEVGDILQQFFGTTNLNAIFSNPGDKVGDMLVNWLDEQDKVIVVCEPGSEVTYGNGEEVYALIGMLNSEFAQCLCMSGKKAGTVFSYPVTGIKMTGKVYEDLQRAFAVNRDRYLEEKYQ